MKKALEERFNEKWIPVPESGCWLWAGSVSNAGYGLILVNGKMRRAHRVGYELYRGAIPAPLVLDHLCRVTVCVNPNHLEAVTRKENILRGVGWAGVNYRKTHCPHGHEYTPENTYVSPAGSRSCLICGKYSKKKHYYKKRGLPMPKNNIEPPKPIEPPKAEEE